MIPSITVMLPTYNRCDTLKISALSVLRQTYGNVKLFILDDCSTDETQEWASNLAVNHKNVTYIRHDKNIGEIENTLYAFNNVESEYFSMLADDDFLLPNFLEEAVLLLEEKKDYDFIICDSLYLDSKYQLCSNKIFTYELKEYKKAPKLFPSGVPFRWESLVYRAKVASSFIDMDTKYEIGADMRFLTFAMSRHSYFYYSRPGGCAVESPTSFSASRGPVQEGLRYRIIQMHRLVEVINDSNVDSDNKKSAMLRLRKWYKHDPLRSWIFSILIDIQHCWESPLNKSKEQFLFNELKALEYEGYKGVSIILKYLYLFYPLKNIYRLTLYPLLEYKRKLRLQGIRRLQQSILKNEFDQIREILRDAPSLK